jgi:hypothetical protein
LGGGIMMDILIKGILEKHGIKDENLAAALAEILELNYDETQRKMESDISISMRMKGIK